MKLTEILNILDSVCKDNSLSQGFIVGGTPRDKILGRSKEIEDIDITTGDKGIHYLAKEASIKLQGPNTSYKVLDDGHAQIVVDGFKIDFSSNFNIPDIRKMLIKAGLEEPTEMQLELYSRDFTCNALLMSLDLKNVLDPTGLGLQDIKKKRLRTCLPAAITLGYDNKRVARILYLAAKLGFDVDPEIIAWVKKNPESLINASPQYVIKKLKSAVKYDLKKTVNLLDQMGLWKQVPSIEELTPYMINNITRI
jgi:tRNA nucleotidyltransferase/poly(A) polymerase